MPNYKEKPCEICKENFKPTSPKHKYCDNCKKVKVREWERKTNRKIKGYKKRLIKCSVCGKKFYTYYKKKKYCGSEECEKVRIKTKSKRADAKRAEKNREITKKRREEYREEKIKYISNYVKKEGYKLLSAEEYVSSHKGCIVLECQEGHEYTCSSFHNFKNNKNRCVRCYIENKYTSRPELKIREFFENNFPNITIKYNSRDLIKPYELNLYFPEHKVAVEVCGLYWHSEVNAGKPKNYHYKKMIMCNKLGIRLVTVFEDEINNRFEVVISRILYALNLISYKINARECYLEELDKQTASEFFNKYHLQGSSRFKKAWGLYYGKELLQAICVGFVTRKHTSKEGMLELKREATLPFYVVRGGASKLFNVVKTFSRKNGYTFIKSYCDMRYGDPFNDVYIRLGFKLISQTKYTPHYFKAGLRFRNQSLRKTEKEKLTGKTEWELRREQGFDRIWDCGHKTYLYTL